MVHERARVVCVSVCMYNVYNTYVCVIRLIGRIIGSLFRKEGESARRVYRNDTDRNKIIISTRGVNELFSPVLFIFFAFLSLKSTLYDSIGSNTIFSLDLLVLFAFTAY